MTILIKILYSVGIVLSMLGGMVYLTKRIIEENTLSATLIGIGGGISINTFLIWFLHFMWTLAI